MKMNITFVLPEIGVLGGVRVVFEYANRLHDRGHKVNVVYPLLPLWIKLKFDLASFTDLASGAIAMLKNRNKNDWFDLKANLVRAPIFSARYVKLMGHLIPDADIVVATSWETAYIVNKLSGKKGAKFYLVQHYEIWGSWNKEECWNEAENIGANTDNLCLAMHDIVPKTKYLRTAKYLVDKTYKLPVNKITISSWLKELIEHKFGEEVKGLIVNGVNFDVFFREEDHSTANRIKVLMPYRALRWKGTEDGLKAFEMVRKGYPDTEFVMYGAKRGKDIPEWVEFHERVSDNELRRLYSSSDIFVLPSWVEGCQLPPMEAMACGCAVVATNVGGVQDYAIHGETILATPARNPEVLARNIIKLIENADERRRIAENGYNYIKQFTWDRATDHLEQVFKNCVQK